MTLEEELQQILSEHEEAGGHLSHAEENVLASITSLTKQVDALQQQVDAGVPNSGAGGKGGTLPPIQIGSPEINFIVDSTGQGSQPPTQVVNHITLVPPSTERNMPPDSLERVQVEFMGLPSEAMSPGQTPQESPFSPVSFPNQQLGGFGTFMNPEPLAPPQLPPREPLPFMGGEFYASARGITREVMQSAPQDLGVSTPQDERVSDLADTIQSSANQLASQVAAIQGTSLQTDVSVGVQVHTNVDVTEQINLSEAIENLGGSPNAFGLSPTI